MISIRHRKRGAVDGWFAARLSAFIERVNDKLIDVVRNPIEDIALQAECDECFKAWHPTLPRTEYAAALSRWLTSGEMAPTLACGAGPEGGFWVDPLQAMRLTAVLHADGDTSTVAFCKTLHVCLWGGLVTDLERTNYRIEMTDHARVAEVLL